MVDYSALNPRTRANLDKAMKDNDSVLIRSIILTAGEINLKNAEAAFRYACRNDDLFGVIEKHNQDMFELKEKKLWDKAYFTRHVQNMMRNFSEQAFKHYLEVGQFLFANRSLLCLYGHFPFHSYYFSIILNPFPVPTPQKPAGNLQT